MSGSKSQKQKILIIDSFFCSKDWYQKHYPQIEISFIGDEKEHALFCDPPRNRLALHGHYLLLEILEALKNQNHHFYLANVFTSKGVQNVNKWETAHKFSEKFKPDLLISATGYFKDQKISHLNFSPLSILAAGNLSNGLKLETKIYPQSNNLSNYYIVGSYLTPDKENGKMTSANRHQVFYDTRNLSVDIIDFFMNTGNSKNNIRGSSLATAKAAAFIMNHCSPPTPSCIEKNKSPIKFVNSSYNREAFTLYTVH